MVAFLISLSVLAYAAAKIIDRYVLKGVSPYAYALVVNTVSAILFLPVALTNIHFPVQDIAWTALIIASILWTMIAVSGLTAHTETEVSIQDPLSQSKALWALLLGIFVLKETASFFRIAGVVTIFLGISLLVWHPERKFGRVRDKGVRWTLGTAVLSALVAIADKKALGFFNPELYGFLVFLLPSFILFFFLPKRTGEVKYLFRNHWQATLIASILLFITYYARLRVFVVMDVSVAYPLLQLSTLLTVLGGIFILREREHLKQKIVAALIVVLGSIFLKF